MESLKAEEMKKLGNEEFQRNNFTKAIKYYTEAISKLLSVKFEIDHHKNEAIYTNRAASYIKIKEFKKALEDCN
jgi:tetratricopeptide (TPR) repeat protein